MVHGHNGRPLRNLGEIALALTILRHLVSMVTTEQTRTQILPGIGNQNFGFIDQIELFHQFEDPSLRLLRASHIVRLPNQQQPNRVYFGESTVCSIRALKVQFYDKTKEMAYRGAIGTDNPVVRFEVLFRDPERLATCLKESGALTGADGQRVATLSPESIFPILRSVLGSLCGFDDPGPPDLASLSKPARLLVMGCSQKLVDPYFVERLIDHYKRTEDPCDRTFRGSRRDIIRYAAKLRLGVEAEDPTSVLDRPLIPVACPGREWAFGLLMKSVGAPDVPAADIVEAWSTSKFLNCVPTNHQTVGHVSPVRMPWNKDTFFADDHE
jgi:hypothetical protein